MFCRFCGKKLNENSQFCPFCGKKINRDEKNSNSRKNDEGIISKNPSAQLSHPNENPHDVHNKKGSRKAVAVIGVVIVTALVLVIAVFALGNKNDNTNGLDFLKRTKEQKEKIEPQKTETAILPSPSPSISPSPRPSLSPSSTPAVSLPTSSPTPNEITQPSVKPDAAETDDSNSGNKMMNAYRELLQEVHDNPEDYVTLEKPKDIEGCDFSIYDLNQDGMDDLIITFTNTFTGMQYTGVWTYQSETGQVEELDRFGEYWQYYSNGVIKDNASHNQTYGSALWPYTLIRYNKSTKKLEAFASAYCVDKEWGSASGEYKESLDSDGDGVLYYFELNGTTHGPLTREEYLSYANQYISEKLSVVFKWTAITNENIAKVK